ncbi:MAG: hemolysin III family protein [Planctomycetes bacterium]|nr:hemolysin III family protein [Planctomycetota bacterium]
MEVIEVHALPGIREPINCFTHLLAAVVFSIVAVYLIRRGRGCVIRTASLAVMAGSSVLLLLMSAGYHMLWPGTARDVMRQLDIAAVFVLIAGTITPVHAILDRGIQRWGSLLLVWSLAIVGITLRTVYADRISSEIGIAIFLLFGWGGLISCLLLWKRFGFEFVQPMIWGGLSYTVGAVCLSLHWPILLPRFIGPHELWHVAVLMGLALHWKFVFQFAHGIPAVQSGR